VTHFKFGGPNDIPGLAV